MTGPRRLTLAALMVLGSLACGEAQPGSLGRSAAAPDGGSMSGPQPDGGSVTRPPPDAGPADTGVPDDPFGLGPVDWQVVVDITQMQFLEGYIEFDVRGGRCRIGAGRADLTRRSDCPTCSAAFTFVYSDLFVASGPPDCRVPESVAALIEGARIHFGHRPADAGAGLGTLLQNESGPGDPDGSWEPYTGGDTRFSLLALDRALDVWVYGAERDRLGLGL